MANIDFFYPADRAVRFLNAAPLIEALRFQPEDFELKHGWLTHAPSRHRCRKQRRPLEHFKTALSPNRHRYDPFQRMHGRRPSFISR